ncbi:MAG: response regulator [Treponemataceae bacterium]|nr:response regulator [Treponemataceae bacterium]
MSEIIFLAEAKGANQKFFDEIEPIFHCKFQDLTEDALTSIRKENPSLIIACADYLFDFQRDILDSILMSITDIPFVVAADRETCHFYHQSVQSDIVGYIITPVSEMQFLNRMRTIWDAMKKKKPGEKTQIADSSFGFQVQTKRRILVVDDDPVCLRQMMNLLKNDYIVSVVKSGQDCLDFLKHDKPDLILLDYEMPEMNGVETLTRIRKHIDYDKIPVLFLTAVSDKQLVQEALLSKPQGYLLKNSGSAAIIKKIESFFGG